MMCRQRKHGIGGSPGKKRGGLGPKYIIISDRKGRKRSSAERIIGKESKGWPDF